ncbi:MAG: XdhC family protein [Oscillospiraceae bacterium]|jgi:xanthine dehydrogenase accessory factor|nr:XdhC family protein [Oscillospiraceae bacterium]
MKRLVPDILAALRRGERVLLTAVIESRGSTPRKTGSVMAVFENGSKGTVGGGAVEYEVQRVAREMLETGAPEAQSLGYSLSSDGLGDLCMICGGDVGIHYCALRPTAELISVFESAETAPPDGSARLTLRISEGEPTAIVFEPNSDAAAGRKARYDKLSENYDGTLTLPLGEAGRVYIFGGGHVGRELVPVLSHVGFNCVVFDDREEFASPEHFPDAERIIFGDFKRIWEHVTLTARDYVIVITRGHKNDYEVLEQSLPTPAAYVGAMGSKRKMAIIRERLREEAGLAPEVVARLVSPIGLQIGAETPEELAISMAAQLIQFRAENE